MHFVGIFVVMLLAVRKNDSSAFECYIVCHLIHSVYTYSVAHVHIARSWKKSTLKLKCTCLFNWSSSILFIIVTQLTVFTLIIFVSHLYSVRFLSRRPDLSYHILALRHSYAN
jgi:hypothetical protein